MEQTNLVVTPDGKTWDEVTRDVSYMGPQLYIQSRDAGDVNYDAAAILDVNRGILDATNNTHEMMAKNFTIAYDRHICLVSGLYEIIWTSHYSDAGSAGQLRGSITLNSTAATTAMLSRAGKDSTTWGGATNYACVFLTRGDWITLWGGYWGTDQSRTNFTIKKL
jgi:hypothetical protein